MSALLLVFGLVLVALGCQAFRQYRRLSRRGEQVFGTVVDLHWQYSVATGDSPGSRICHPVLAFRIVDGRDIRAEARAGTGWAIAQPGEQVPVIYDPANPVRAQINTRAARGAWAPAVFIRLGGPRAWRCG